MIVDWYTSDLHFGHSRIIEMCHRPFNDVEEMNEELVRRYNERVEPSDTVVFAGDIFFMGMERAREILGSMHGTKILVCGNHDKRSRKMAELGFDLVTKGIFFNLQGVPVRVSHYPYRRQVQGGDWDSMGREGDDRYLERHPKYSAAEILIHGHTHSASKRSGNMIHVGVDAWDYRPASRLEVLELIGETEL